MSDNVGTSVTARGKRLFMRSIITIIMMPCLAVLFEIISHKYHTTRTFKHTLLANSGLIHHLQLPSCLPPPPFTLYSSQVVLPSNAVRPAYITINSHGKIDKVSTVLHPAVLRYTNIVVDVSPLTVMPGLIDPHVHVNQPGDVSEGFYTATRAAAAGGTTTILDMPLNSIPCTLDRESFHQKYQELNISQPAVDVGFIGGITPENMEHIKELMDEGVISLKSFMVDSQTKEFVHVEKHDLEQAVDILHEMATKYYPKAAPIPYMLHAEIPIVDKQDDSHMKMYDHKSYIDYEASRPSTWELEAVQLALRSANNSRVHIYIAHVSSHDVVEYIKDIHFNKGLKEARVSLETCPHYLVWASDEIESGNTLLKCSPPMRDSSNRDHSPCIAALKQTEGNLTNAWGGISGLQYRLQGTWTAAKKGGVSVAKLVNLLSEGPARKFGLDKLKGSLKEGLDADMVVWDPNVKVTLSPETCHHREKASAFHGDTVDGRIEYTLLRGQGVFSRRNEGIGGEFGCCKDSYGRLLRRQAETGIVF